MFDLIMSTNNNEHENVTVDLLGMLVHLLPSKFAIKYLTPWGKITNVDSFPI